jgi:hypothetical protein
MKTLIYTIVIVALWGAAAVSADVEKMLLPPREPVADIFKSVNIPQKLIIRDAQQIYWSFFTSSYFGFEEFWVAYSRDKKNWSRALYTGIPVLPGKTYQLRVSDQKIDVDWFGPLINPAELWYYRSSIDTTIWGYTIFKDMLYNDSDADGLSDLSEDVLWTHPFEMDTDGDGKADGYDANPLAPPAEDLTQAEKLHKTLIEYELDRFPSNQLVAVEQFNDRPMEYDREAGLILSLSPQGCDAYVEANGYGVPILTCMVKDTLDDKYKANFQFFVSPDDAWGYEAIFEWDSLAKVWRQDGDFLDEWQAR